MKQAITFAFLLLCIIQVSFSQDKCTTPGYYDNGASTTQAPCRQCSVPYETCDFVTPSNSYNGKISTDAYRTVSNQVQNRCPSGTYFNPSSTTCEVLCKVGCSSCRVTYDYCTDCEPGYAWAGYSCLPAVVGLSAASLALLVITLIFGIMIIVRSGGK